jgi:hypothetical protein
VRRYIEERLPEFPEVRTLTSMTAERLAAAAGLVYPRGRGGRKFVFDRPVFENSVCAGLSPRLALRHLSAEGLLHRNSDGKTSVQREFAAPLGRARVISVSEAILRRR